MLFILLPAWPRRKARPGEAVDYTDKTLWLYHLESSTYDTVSDSAVQDSCGCKFKQNQVSEGAAWFDGFSNGSLHAERLQWCVPFVLCALSAEVLARQLRWLIRIVP